MRDNSARALLAGTTSTTRASAEELIATSAERLHDLLFGLLDRDHSGYVDEADVVAALQCQLRSTMHASLALARVSEEGHVDALKLRALLEGLLPTTGDATTQHERLVRLVLAVVKDCCCQTGCRAEAGCGAKGSAPT